MEAGDLDLLRDTFMTAPFYRISNIQSAQITALKDLHSLQYLLQYFQCFIQRHSSVMSRAQLRSDGCSIVE